MPSSPPLPSLGAPTAADADETATACTPPRESASATAATGSAVKFMLIESEAAATSASFLPCLARLACTVRLLQCVFFYISPIPKSLLFFWDRPFAFSGFFNQIPSAKCKKKKNKIRQGLSVEI